MNILKCPIPTTKEWKALVELVGKDETWRLYIENGYEIPNIKEVELTIPSYKNLIESTKEEVYSNLGLRVLYKDNSDNSKFRKRIKISNTYEAVVVDVSKVLDTTKYPDVLAGLVDTFKVTRGYVPDLNLDNEFKDFYDFTKTKGWSGLDFGDTIYVDSNQNFKNNETKLKGYLGVKRSRTTKASPILARLKSTLGITKSQFSEQEKINLAKRVEKYNKEFNTAHSFNAVKIGESNLYAVDLIYNPQLNLYNIDKDIDDRLVLRLYDKLLEGFNDFYEQQTVVDVLYSNTLKNLRDNIPKTIYKKKGAILSEIEYTSLSEEDKKGYKARVLPINYSAAYDNFIEQLEKYKDQPSFKNHKGVQLILLNKKELKELVKKKLTNLGIIIKQELQRIDLYGEELVDESGATIDLNTWVDGWVFKYDSKENAGKQVKMFLSTIPKYEYNKDLGKNIPVTSELSKDFPLYYTYDTVFEALKALLTDTNNTWDSFNTKLESYRNLFPPIDSMLNVLANYKGDKQRLIHQFVRTLTSTETNEKTALIKTSEDNISFKLVDTDRSSVISSILTDWSDNFENESNIVNKDGLTKNKENLNSYLDFIKDIQSLAIDFIKYWVSINKDENKLDKGKYIILYDKLDRAFNDIGISLSERTLKDFILTDFGTKPKYKKNIAQQFTLSYGLFPLLVNKLKGEEQIEEENILSFNPINGTGDRISVIRDLAEYESNYNKLVVSSGYINGKNDNVQSYSLTKFISDELRRLKEDSIYLEDIYNTSIFNKPIIVNGELLYESWLYKLVNIKGAKDVLELSTVDTLKEDRMGSTGKALTELTEREFEILRVNNILTTNYYNNRKTNDKIINYLLTVPAKFTAYYVKGFGVNFELIFSNNDYKIPNKVLNSLLATALSEYNRIKYSANLPIENKAYKQGSQKFLIYPFLNKDTETGKNLWQGSRLKELDTKITINEIETTVEQQIKTLIASNVKSAIQDTIVSWTDLGLVQNNKLIGINEQYQNIHKAKKDVELLQQAASEYIINSMLAKYNMHQLFIGDPALYYKKDIRTTWDNIEKRLASMIAPYNSLSLTTGEESLVYIKLKDNESKSYNYTQLLKRLGEKLATPYENINSTDAQEYTTLREHLFVEYRLGNIDTNKYNTILNKINIEGDTLVLNKEDLEIVFTPHKPVYSGSNINKKFGYIEKIYVKSSSIPLLHQFTKGLELDKVRKELERIENKLNENKQEYTGVRAAYESAIKVGGKEAVNIWETDNTVKDNLTFDDYITVKRKNFGIQQELPLKKDQYVTRATQVTKQLFDSLLNTEGYYYKSPETGETIKYTGEELYKVYLNLHEQLFSKGLNKVKKLLFDDNGRVDTNKLAELLKEELSKNNASSAQLESMDVKGGEFSLPLWANPSINTLQPIITSIFTQNILKQDMHGKAYVLVSPAGFKGNSSDITYLSKRVTREENKTIEELLALEVPEKLKAFKVQVDTINPNTNTIIKVEKTAEIALESAKKQYEYLKELYNCLTK